MNVRELTRDQLEELKSRMICERNEERGGGMSWYEIVHVNSLISDEEVFRRYAGFIFFDDDFYCTAGATHAEPVQAALF